jgi:transcriptional regulator with XRE-family HTH domain
MGIKKILGSKIKRLRQKEGLTQEQFAEKIGIATRTLAGIEIGENFVSANTIDSILNYTGLSFEDFTICSHLRPVDELLEDIYVYLDKIKDNREKVESIYKVIKAISNE